MKKDTICLLSDNREIIVYHILNAIESLSDKEEDYVTINYLAFAAKAIIEISESGDNNEKITI